MFHVSVPEYKTADTRENIQRVREKKCFALYHSTPDIINFPDAF